MTTLDLSSPTWPFMLGMQFLAAAQSCGFTCERAFVHDGITPEGMPPGCPCQLAAVVAPGWMPEPSGKPINCVPRITADVRLYLDLCVVAGTSDHVPGAIELNPSASKNLQALWQVMAGLQKARYHGDIADGCSSVNPAAWQPISQEGVMARWMTTWKVKLS